MRKTIRYLFIIALTFIICLCGYKLWKMSERYVQEERLGDRIEKYRPLETAPTAEPSGDSESVDYLVYSETQTQVQTQTETQAETVPQTNRFVTDLQNEVNKDVAGWLRIPNTHIDYPFVKSKDNSDYLRRDLYGKYALAGTVFMDCGNSGDFTDFNTVIYGHNMKNTSMFGDLSLFADEGFFDSNRTGTIYTAGDTYELEFFACMTVNADDGIIYNTDNTGSPAERNEFFEYVKKNSVNYREPDTGINGGINIATLSTCSYQFEGARIVLLATINLK